MAGDISCRSDQLVQILLLGGSSRPTILEDVRHQEPVVIDGSPEGGLRKRCLPQDQVWSIRWIRHQPWPVRYPHFGQLGNIDIRRHTADVPDAQLIGSGKKSPDKRFGNGGLATLEFAGAAGLEKKAAWHLRTRAHRGGANGGKSSSRRTSFRWSDESLRYPSLRSCCRNREALMADTCAASARSEPFLNCLWGRSSRLATPTPGAVSASTG